MTVTTTLDPPSRVEPIEHSVAETFSPGWNRLEGVTVEGTRLVIEPGAYFVRYDDPTWLLCDWDEVRRDLLDAVETPEAALEQQVLDYVRTNGRTTTDPAEVLRTASKVYAYLFRDELADEPGLSDVNREHLRMLREMGTMMALNRVELTGHISVIGPAWFFPVAAQVVYGLSDSEAEALDELYHGGFFNESRRVESVKAHAALGGRLVHGCQSSADMSGGVVVPYGADVARFREELETFKAEWMDRIRRQARQ